MKKHLIFVLLITLISDIDINAQRRGGGFRSSGFGGGRRTNSSLGVGRIHTSPTPMRNSSYGRQFSSNRNAITQNRGSQKHVLYRKYNPSTHQTYIGRTKGYGSPSAIVKRRDANHHMSAKGYNKAQLLRSSTNKDAIRGAEHKLIQAHAARGRSGNSIKGIADNNPKRPHYLKQSDLTLRHTKKLPD